MHLKVTGYAPVLSSASWPPGGTRAALWESQQFRLLRGCAQLQNKALQRPCPPQQNRHKGTHQPCTWVSCIRTLTAQAMLSPRCSALAMTTRNSTQNTFISHHPSSSSPLFYKFFNLVVAASEPASSSTNCKLEVSCVNSPVSVIFVPIFCRAYVTSLPLQTPITL